MEAAEGNDEFLKGLESDLDLDLDAM